MRWLFSLSVVTLLTNCAGEAESHPPPAEPAQIPSGPPSGAPVDIDHIVALAATCARAEPHDGLGRAGTSLDFDSPASLSPVEGGQWSVLFAETAPETHPHGLEVAVDPSARTCDSTPVEVASGAPRGVSPDQLIAYAWDCAHAEHGGTGVGESPLVRDSATVRWVRDGDRFIVSFLEESRTTLPTGLSLSVSVDGERCGSVAMD